MVAIQAALIAAGTAIAHATLDGKRCHPGNAYKANGAVWVHTAGTTYAAITTRSRGEDRCTTAATT